MSDFVAKGSMSDFVAKGAVAPPGPNRFQCQSRLQLRHAGWCSLSPEGCISDN